MKTKPAILTAFILVSAHTVYNVLMLGKYMFIMFRILPHSVAGSLFYFGPATLIAASTIMLDVAVLLLLKSLTGQKEQLPCNPPDTLSTKLNGPKKDMQTKLSKLLLAAACIMIVIHMIWHTTRLVFNLEKIFPIFVEPGNNHITGDFLFWQYNLIYFAAVIFDIALLIALIFLKKMKRHDLHNTPKIWKAASYARAMTLIHFAIGAGICPIAVIQSIAMPLSRGWAELLFSATTYLYPLLLDIALLLAFFSLATTETHQILASFPPRRKKQNKL